MPLCSLLIRLESTYIYQKCSHVCVVCACVPDKYERYVEGAPDAAVISTQQAGMYIYLSQMLTHMCGLCTCT